MDTSKDWDEGVPLVLFAIIEAVQESHGISPAELVFGHTVRGPLKMLKENLLSFESSPKVSGLDYVSKFRDGFTEPVPWQEIHWKVHKKKYEMPI